MLVDAGVLSRWQVFERMLCREVEMALELPSLPDVEVKIALISPKHCISRYITTNSYL